VSLRAGRMRRTQSASEAASRLRWWKSVAGRRRRWRRIDRSPMKQRSG